MTLDRSPGWAPPPRLPHAPAYVAPPALETTLVATEITPDGPAWDVTLESPVDALGAPRRVTLTFRTRHPPLPGQEFTLRLHHGHP